MARVCAEILREEEAMVAWLSEHPPKTAKEYLRREETPGQRPAIGFAYRGTDPDRLLKDSVNPRL